MDIPRPTASTITDDQLDALWDALDQIEALHHEAPEYDGYGQPSPSGNCVCGEPGPCTTLKIISRQRSIALESTCPRSPTGRSD
jgi:hypothetical protein